MTHLLWSPPPSSEQNGIIINYVIYITEKSSGCPFEKSTSNTSLSIDENLHPYHTYICEIAAETSVGLGPFSVAVFFTTHEDGMYSTAITLRVFRHPIRTCSDLRISTL